MSNLCLASSIFTPDPTLIRHQVDPCMPFLKWAGGKQWLTPTINSVYKQLSPNNYFEPFLGGGSTFFGTLPVNAHLSDVNSDLINTYTELRENCGGIIKALKKLEYSEDKYYEVRSWRPRTTLNRAVQFIYLNRTCWNGLYRVNLKGQFNVPIGRFSRVPDFVGEEKLLAASNVLKYASSIKSIDFEKAIESATYKDFIFLDPPYTVFHNNNGFIKYNENLFSWKDQERLACCVKRLKNRGTYIAISNADHSSIFDLFEGFYFYRARRLSRIAGKSESRKGVSELLITNFFIEDTFSNLELLDTSSKNRIQLLKVK